jgi:tetratricopeptide (TPR) repeat protein
LDQRGVAAMRQLPIDKYNVAWFKLAEFVARGEKERALGLYRLLVHSFDDHALACQLEGDLLLSFNDKEAIEKYLEAAVLYEKQGRLMEAVAIYEHIITLEAQSEYSLKKVLVIYEEQGNKDRSIEILKMISFLYVDEKKYEVLAEFIKNKEQCYSSTSLAILYEHIVLSLARQNDGNHELISSYGKKVIDSVLEQDGLALQSFLSKLQAINEDFYTEMCLYIEECT